MKKPLKYCICFQRSDSIMARKLEFELIHSFLKYVSYLECFSHWQMSQICTIYACQLCITYLDYLCEQTELSNVKMQGDCKVGSG